MSHAPPNWVFSVFSFVGFILCCIPFRWHLAAWNTGTCLYMAWTGLTCLALFINSIVWNGNVVNWAPVWCDITARLYVGVSFAVPATSLCIARRLYYIASVRNAMVGRDEKRRTVFIDIAIGVGIPVLGMILQYIPQGHRFDIFEDIGCFPFTYVTPVAIVLVPVPPVVIGCVSSVYAVMGILAFNKSRKQFNELLSGSGLNSHRYVRLMCLAGFGSFSTVTLGTIGLIRTITNGFNPWLGWADTHTDFSRVNEIPSLFWRADPMTETSIELSRWLNVICAFAFFGFFGFAQEARKNYHSVAKLLAERIPISTTASFTFFNSSRSKPGVVSNGSHATLPIYIHSHTVRKVDDADAFSNMSVSVLDDEKANPFPSSVTTSLSDVGSYDKAEHYSPSSTPSHSPSPVHPPGLPHASPTWRPDSVMDIPSVRHPDVHESAASLLRPVLDITSAPRHSTDTPSGVHSGRDDMV